MTPIIKSKMVGETSRALATGIAVCGTGVGMLVLPPFIQLILTTYGWRQVSYQLLFLDLSVKGTVASDLSDWRVVQASKKLGLTATNMKT